MTRTAVRPVRPFALAHPVGSAAGPLVCVPRVAARLDDRWERAWSVAESAGRQVADQFHTPGVRLASVTVSDPQRVFADWVRPSDLSGLTGDQRDGCWSNRGPTGRPADGTPAVRFDGGRSVTFLFEADDGSEYATGPIDLDELMG